MTSKIHPTRQELLRDNEELRIRLAESEETLRAIREGEVDAVVVTGTKGEQVFSLVGSESIYRLIVETMKEAAFTVTFDGTILFCNAQFGQFVKRPMEQVVGHPLKEFVVADQRAGVDELLHLSRHKSVKQRLELLNSDGTTVPTHIAATVLNQPDGLSICVVATELTYIENSTELIRQLRLQQETLKESEERYRTLFNGMTEGFAIHEIITNEQGTPVDWRFLDINPAFERLTGLKREDVVGKTHSEAMPGDDVRWLQMYGEVALTGRPVQFENYSPVLNRHYEVLAYCPSPRQFAVIFMDITERRRREEELHKLNRTLGALRRSDSFFMRVETEKNYLDEVCRIIVQDCGYAMVWIGYAEDDAGKTVRPVASAGFEDGYLKTLNVTWDDSERGRGPTGTAIRTGEPCGCANMRTDPNFAPWREQAIARGYSSSLVVPLVSETGRSAGTEGAVSGRRKAFGAITIYASEPDAFTSNEVDLFRALAADLAHGISMLRLREQNKLAEKELRRTSEELRRSNDDLQQFAYVASHDLQEPLRMVGGFLSLIQSRYGSQLDAKGHEYIEFAVDGATRMAGLIKDLLEYSRVGSRGVAPTPVDFAQVLERVKTNLRTAMDESKAVVTNDPLPTVVADATQMTQLLQNLIGNALKFRVDGNRPEVHVGVRRADGVWTFHVRDNGIGIDPRHADRIFMIFQRLHARDQYPGTGIGLAVCRKIVERHGGKIWVESEEGKGCTFLFTLPDGVGNR